MNAGDLQRVLSAHEAFLAGRPGGARLDLTAAVLQGVDLSGRNLARATFDGYLEDVRFDGADLEEATFRKARLRRCSFRGARLRGANLRRASLQGCSFENADLRDADLTRATVGDLDLRGADLAGAIFYDTVIDGAEVYGSHGFWARSEDNRLESLDFSPAGDGSDIRDGEAWIDPVHGRPRPVRIRLALRAAESPVGRVEPNAPEREIPLDQLPVSPGMREALRGWAERYDEAVVENHPLPAEIARSLAEEGRSLQERLRSELPGYDVAYDPSGSFS